MDAYGGTPAVGKLYSGPELATTKSGCSGEETQRAIALICLWQFLTSDAHGERAAFSGQRGRSLISRRTAPEWLALRRLILEQFVGVKRKKSTSPKKEKIFEKVLTGRQYAHRIVK
jgi:hypothetical protein